MIVSCDYHHFIKKTQQKTLGYASQTPLWETLF